MSDTQDRVLYKPEDAASRLQVSRTTVYDLINSGDLVRVKVGRAARITSESVDGYIARLVQQASHEQA
jgi:excisionase family DNA binding protein